MRSPALLSIAGCLTLTTLTLGQQSGAPSGTISGTVVNEASEFVAGATVFAFPVDGRAIMHVRSAETDKDGHFTIEHLQWGTYRLFGEKQDDGYPDTHMWLYDNGTLSECILAPESTPAATIVSIGPRAGIVTGTISDASTGTPIPNAGITLWFWNHKERPFVLPAGSLYRALIPPDQPVGIEVDAPGYEAWHHLGIGNSPEETSLQLKSGESLTINIALKPVAK